MSILKQYNDARKLTTAHKILERAGIYSEISFGQMAIRVRPEDLFRAKRTLAI